MYLAARDSPGVTVGTSTRKTLLQDIPLETHENNAKAALQSESQNHRFMNGLLSTVWKKSKTYNFARKWSLPWGRGDWTPWGDGNGAPAAAATAVCQSGVRVFCRCLLDSLLVYLPNPCLELHVIRVPIDHGMCLLGTMSPE